MPAGSTERISPLAVFENSRAPRGVNASTSASAQTSSNEMPPIRISRFFMKHPHVANVDFYYNTSFRFFNTFAESFLSKFKNVEENRAKPS